MSFIQRNFTIFQNQIFFTALILLLGFSNCKVAKQEVTTLSPPPAPTAPKAPPAKKQTWQKSLKTNFRASYNAAVKSHTDTIQKYYPVVLQDFLNMTLLRTNGEKVRFKMKKKKYFTLAHATHPPVTVYLMLKNAGFKIDEATFQQLSDYAEVLQNAKKGIREVTHLSAGEKERSTKLIDLTEAYLQEILNSKQASKEAYRVFAKTIQPLFEQNLYDTAKDQLEQFQTQMNQWKSDFPEEKWDELRVAIYGFHQARELYAQKQFFQWLLNEPEFERKVTFVEFQFSPFGQNREKAEGYALELLTKVDFDKDPAMLFLGEEVLLQQDVLGPATKLLLEELGESDWFSEN